MPSALQLLDQLNEHGPTIHGVARPDPQSDDALLFSPHRDLDQAVSIPSDHILGLFNDGELRGLGPEFRSVGMVLRKDVFDVAGLGPAIKLIQSRNFSVQSKPVNCYSDGKWIPCP